MGSFTNSLAFAASSYETTTTTMNLDCYTQYIPLTAKARFWGNFVSALKGGKDLYAAPEPHVRNFYPSIVEYIPTADSKTKNEFGRLEDLMWRSRRGTACPLHPSCPRPTIESTLWDTIIVLSTRKF